MSVPPRTMADVERDFLAIMKGGVASDQAAAAEKVAALVNESAEVHARTAEREHSAITTIRMSFALFQASERKKAQRESRRALDEAMNSGDGSYKP